MGIRKIVALAGLLVGCVVAAAEPASRPRALGQHPPLPASPERLPIADPMRSPEPPPVVTRHSQPPHKQAASSAKQRPEEMLYVAGCVPHQDNWEQPWELMLLARHDGEQWTELVGAVAKSKSVPPALEPDHPLARLPEYAKALKHVRWLELPDFGTEVLKDVTGFTFHPPAPILLDNFESEALYGVSLGTCSREKLGSLLASAPIIAVRPSPDAQRTVLTALKQESGVYAHWWFKRGDDRGPLLTGGNTSGMFPGGGGGSRSAYAGGWFGQLDERTREVAWLSFVLRHY